jgi:hypothetical protein
VHDEPVARLATARGGTPRAGRGLDDLVRGGPTARRRRLVGGLLDASSASAALGVGASSASHLGRRRRRRASAVGSAVSSADRRRVGRLGRRLGSGCSTASAVGLELVVVLLRHVSAHLIVVRSAAGGSAARGRSGCRREDLEDELAEARSSSDTMRIMNEHEDHDHEK